MKKILLICLTLLANAAIYAQTQIENPGFELTWEDVLGAEDEPIQWSSLKTADALTALAPVVAFKESTTYHSGAYSIRLKVVNTLGVNANGIMTNGRVHADFTPANGNVFTDVAATQWNLAFTVRPDSLVIWVKHTPVGADKSKVEILLHDNSSDGELPHDGVTSNWVGKARIDVTGTISAWTRMSVPFSYYNTSSPDYLLAVLVAGDSTIAVANTEMWLDDIELIYNTKSVAVTPSSTQNIDIATNGTVLSVTSIGNAEVIAPITQEWKYSTTSGSGYVSFGTPETGTTYTPNFATVGIYYVVCEASFTTNSGLEVITSNEVEIVVTDPLVNSVTISPSSTQTILLNEDGSLLAATETPAAASSREWKSSTVSGSGYASFGVPETGLTYLPNFSVLGTYYIICESDFSGDIQISNEVTIIVPSAAGIHEENFEFNIYTNSENLVVNLSDVQNNTSLAIYSLDGKLIYHSSINEPISLHEINASGIFIYTVVTGDKIITGKTNL